METSDSFADSLVRNFVPAKRIVVSDKATTPEVLLGSKVLRTFVTNSYPSCRIATGGFVVIDFGRELSGGVRIVTQEGMKLCKIRLRFGESVSEAVGTPNMDHAIHDVELPLRQLSSIDFGNTGFRFVRIDVLEGEAIFCNVIAILEWREAIQRGRFITSDDELNAIYDTAVHTIHLNMQDFIYDGVKRDRLVWGGDMHPEAITLLRVFGDHPVLRDSLELLRNNTPDGRFINGFSSYSLWYFITLYDQWMHSGDDSLLRANAELFAFEQKRFDTLVSPDGIEQLPDRRFLDWPSDNDPAAVHSGLQALTLMGLTALEKMLRYLGQDASIAASCVARLKKHVPDPGDNKAAAALQHLAGLCDRRDVLERNPYHGVSTFLGYYMLLAKENSKALDLIKKYWGGMLKLGATSFWEDFNLDWVPNATRIDEMPVAGRPDIHADFGAFCYVGLRHSLCHGWASGPAAWCSKRILGVEPLDPGFRKISFKPDLCGLEYANGSIPTPFGEININLRKGTEPQIDAPKEISIN